MGPFGVARVEPPEVAVHRLSTALAGVHPTEDALGLVCAVVGKEIAHQVRTALRGVGARLLQRVDVGSVGVGPVLVPPLLSDGVLRNYCLKRSQS